MRTATFIKELDNFKGVAKLYRFDPPLVVSNWDEKPKSYEYVVVSAVVAGGSGPETYLFPSTPEGKVTDWLELDGSQRGTLSHNRVIEALGYKIREA